MSPYREGVSAHSRARAALGAICELIRNRTPINRACALENVPRRSFYDLLDADPEARDLVDQARAAAAHADEIELRHLIASGSKSSNVMLHLMERLYPDDYAPPKQRVEQTGRDGGPQEHKIVVSIDDALDGARGKEPQ